jgi:hypothetical protein
LGCHVLGQAVLEAGGVGVDHLAHAGDLCGGVGGSASVVPGDEHVHVPSTLSGSGDGVQGRALDGGVVVFGNNECGQLSVPQITLASFFSLSTRAATSATLMPAPRLGGSLTFSVLMRGVTSTPRSSGFTMSSVFFLAFMMLGSVT